MIKKKTYSRKTSQAVVSSPLTGRPKLRNFLPGACGSFPPAGAAVLDGMTHTLRYLHTHLVAFQDIVNVQSSYRNMNKVVASALHLQASANNFSSTQQFSNTIPSLWPLESDVTLFVLRSQHSFIYL